MTSFKQREHQKKLQIEKIKALDLANKVLLQAQADYERIVAYYNMLGV